MQECIAYQSLAKGSLEKLDSLRRNDSNLFWPPVEAYDEEGILERGVVLF